MILEHGGLEVSVPTRRDAAFIARARTLLPALAKALRAAKPAGDALTPTERECIEELRMWRSSWGPLWDLSRVALAIIDRIAPKEGA